MGTLSKTVLIHGCGVVGRATAAIIRRNQTRSNPWLVYGRDKNPDKQDRMDIGHTIKLSTFDIHFVCVPTNLASGRYLDLAIVYEVIDAILEDKPTKSITIVIRSTIGIGAMDIITKRYPSNWIFHYWPEFLCESKVVESSNYPPEDVLYPARTVLGYKGQLDSGLVKLLSNAAALSKIDPKCTGNLYLVDFAAAEYIKLYSNAYLSTRLAFFAGLKDQAIANDVDYMRVIDAVTDDPRIGKEYCDPPFTIAGKCLPKDLMCLANETKSNLLRSATEYIEGYKGL